MSALIAARPGPLRSGLRAMLLMMPQVESVIQVNDASSVLSAVREHRPALVLLDGSLFRNGLSPVVRTIKKNGYQGQCLVLANDVPQREEAESAGADVALVKGFPAARLFEIVRELVS